MVQLRERTRARVRSFERAKARTRERAKLSLKAFVPSFYFVSLRLVSRNSNVCVVVRVSTAACVCEFEASCFFIVHFPEVHFSENLI